MWAMVERLFTHNSPMPEPLRSQKLTSTAPDESTWVVILTVPGLQEIGQLEVDETSESSVEGRRFSTGKACCAREVGAATTGVNRGNTKLTIAIKPTTMPTRGVVTTWRASTCSFA